MKAERTHKFKFLRGVTLKAMALLAMAIGAGAARAVTVTNAFAIVDGDGIELGPGGGLVINPDVPGDITITPLAGWDFGQPGPIVIPRGDAIRPEGFNPTSDLGEAEGHFCTLEVHTNDVHIGKMDATVVAEDVIAMYAVPDRYAIVSDSASYEGDLDCTHLQTATYSGCAICGQPEDSETRYVAGIDIDWTASASGITTNSAVWTGPMAKGGHTVHFSMHAECQACGASTGGTAAGGATVYELSIDLPDEYLGLNMTDGMKGKYVTRTATAKVDPAPPKVEYAWSDCGRCEWRSATTRENVTYGATDKTGPSSSYRAEPLTVGATVTKGDLSASANCTTNFTVVKVDVQLAGTTEEDEESKRPEIYYIAEEQDEILSATGFKELKALRVSCKPENLPEPNAVSLLASSGARIYEITEDGKVSLVTKPYACGEIGKKKFGVHGHSVSELKDWGEVIYAKNDVSQATDSCRVKVVQPPPLEVSVAWYSPATGGAWPYDPVWNDPMYAKSVRGDIAQICAENTDCSRVEYSLSRDACNVRLDVLRKGFFSDDVVGEGLPASSEGVHNFEWDMPNDLDVGDYYVKLSCTELETGKPHPAKSDEGGLDRKCYYCSDASDEMLLKEYIVTLEQKEALEKLIRQEGYILSAMLIPFHWGVAFAASVINTELTSLPSWYVAGTKIYSVEWHTWKKQWSTDKYIIPQTITHGKDDMYETNGFFEMGYQGVVYSNGTGLGGEGKSTLASFYSGEKTCMGVVQYGVTTWIWQPAPNSGYGLLCPKCCMVK